MARRSRRILRRLVLIALPFALVALTAVALVTTAPGRHLITAAIETAISTPDMAVEIGTLDLQSLGSVRIDRLAAADAGGSWLEATEVEIDWRPLALLSGRVTVDRVAARRIVVTRMPEPGETPTADGSGLSVPPITVAQVSFPAVVLGQPVLGAAAEVSVSGHLHLADPADSLTGALDISRIDGVAGAITSRFAYRPQDDHLTLHLDAREPEGGLIVSSLAVPELPEFAAAVDGEGPLDDWRATVSVAAGGKPVLSGTARLARVAGGRLLTVAAGGYMQSVIGGEAAALFEGHSRLDVQALIGDDRRIVLHGAEFSATQLGATASGTVTPAGAVESADIAVTLADPGGRFQVGAGRASLRAAHVEATIGPDALAMRVTVEGLQSAELSVATVAIRGEGRLTGPLTGLPWEIAGATIEGELDGVAVTDIATDALIGRTVAFSGSGSVRRGTVTVDEATARTGAGRAGFDGTIEGDRIDGRYTLAISDLSRLSAAAGRDIAGALDLTGTVRAANGAHAVTVDGEVREPRTGADAADRLLGSRVTLKGGVSRSPDGTVQFDDLTVAAQHLTATIAGQAGAQTARLEARGTVMDLGTVSASLGGSIDFAATVSGTMDDAVIEASATGSRMVIAGHGVDRPRVRFDGTGPLAAPQGDLTVTGRFDGRPIDGSARLAIAHGLTVDDLTLAVGRSRASGRLAFDADSGLAGAVSVAVSDLEEWRGLAGIDLAGTLHGDFTLATTDGVAELASSMRASDLAVADMAVGALSLDGTIRDMFGTAVTDGRVEASPVRIGDLTLAGVDMTARADGQATRGSVRVRLGEAAVAASGSLRVEHGRITVDLDSPAESTPSRFVFADGRATMTDAAITVDGGRATVNGTAGEVFDLAVGLDSIPARVAGAFVPALDPEGTVSGTLAAKGTTEAPRVTFDLDWQGAVVAQTRAAGLGAFAIDASGTVEDGVATVTGEIAGPSDARLTFAGTAPAGASRPLDLTLKGAVPLDLLNPAFAERGGSMAGTLALDLAVSGTADSPSLAGSLSTSGARLSDPASGIALTDLAMVARLDGEALIVERFQGKTPKDGTISGSGRIGLAPGDGLPADLAITARKLHIDDNQLVEGTLDADLTVTGPLTGGALVAGKVAVERLDITVPDALPHSIARLDVVHRNASAKVSRQVASLAKDASDKPSLPMRVDLGIESGNRIFVRGRGLDVVLGGDITVTGTVADPVVMGSFVQRRGRLDVLGRSLSFTRGRLNFAGDVEPTLDFAAATTSSTTTITVHVSGRARDPQFRFESTPELPQDEVVSRFIFDRPVSKLTPLQIAQLSTELARLGGLAGGPGLLGDLQKSLGLDVLEFSGGTGPGIAAGKYVNDRVYLGVKQTTTGESRAVIDLDITKTVKTKGEFGSDGNSKIGIGVELDY